MADKSISQFSKELTNTISFIQRLALNMLKEKSDAFIKGKITLPQYLVLDLVYRKNALKMKDIASELKVSLPAASGLVDRLVKLKMIKRISDKQDRRVVLIDLTKSGKKTVEDVGKKRKEVIEKIFSPLTSRERQDYLNILNKIKKKFDEKEKN
ncbi:MAG: MarR family transcriptional regulator [Candidatus Omnitrophica bacterium]|nr:MarR family transcriptional regulator [Candidatus Omnitrophota bacterium]MCF7877098.1 MarR family transcriptional regulator [Candidatus Omnitrophota bacterium]MCF7878282.1 MarR family transcriptional regulator [Candidatus Omnitrophota bacterium]MCF7893398.1 MarR family transcriptional regulator [Candidatus Omnitrophota bacterium]